MNVMSGVLGQIGQNVADNLFEIGKSTVKGTTGALTDIANESIEQITSTGSQGGNAAVKPEGQKTKNLVQEEKRKKENERFQEVRSELEQYIQRKKALDQKIAEEKMMQERQDQQRKTGEKAQKDSWVKKMINRAATSTEKGRMQE